MLKLYFLILYEALNEKLIKNMTRVRKKVADPMFRVAVPDLFFILTL